MLRLRAPDGYRMQAVQVHGKEWNQFAPDQEVITLRPESTGEVVVLARFGDVSTKTR